MAIKYSTYGAAVIAAKTQARARANQGEAQQSVRYARFKVVLDGTEAAADTIALGPVGLTGVTLIPELCRVRHGPGGAGVSIPASIGVAPADLAGVVAFTSTVTLVSTAVQTFAAYDAYEKTLAAVCGWR